MKLGFWDERSCDDESEYEYINNDFIIHIFYIKLNIYHSFVFD